ncbi:MAG TPA: type II toxin-antitoxin system VapC family toxin [Tepidisphaeraceae bacterium]|jgi:predicted nucleic acid-binding protein
MLLDSNIIIYSGQARHARLRQWMLETAASVSAISYVEVLGFHRISEADRIAFTDFFDRAIILPITPPILDQAVALRQSHRISLGDSLVAATAIVQNLPLATHNLKDFSWINNLQLLDPLTLP